MGFNYILLAITGIISIFGVYDSFNGTRNVRPLQTIAAVVVFVLVLTATLMNIPYSEFQIMITQKFS